MGYMLSSAFEHAAVKLQQKHELKCRNRVEGPISASLAPSNPHQPADMAAAKPITGPCNITVVSGSIIVCALICLHLCNKLTRIIIETNCRLENSNFEKHTHYRLYDSHDQGYNVRSISTNTVRIKHTHPYLHATMPYDASSASNKTGDEKER